MRLFIDKDILGSTEHYEIIENGKTLPYSLNEFPPNSLVLGTEEYNKFCKLYFLEEPTFPSDNYLKTYRSLRKDLFDLAYLSNSSVPWSLCMPQKVYDHCVQDLSLRIQRDIASVNMSYYVDMFLPSNRILELLKPALIDIDKYQKLLLTNSGLISTLDTFKPSATNSYAAPIYYDRTSSLTGRLTVSDGPDILRLKKEYRSEIFTSRFGSEGSIYSLDFVSLEPRIALLLNNKTNIEDIYSYINAELFNKEKVIDRSIIKKAVISQLYGASTDTLYQELNKNISYEDTERLVYNIDKFFGLTQLRNKLISINTNNCIKNYYGRHINTTNAKPYMLVNYYIQSTAVDIALSSFSKIMSEAIKEKDRQQYIVPLYVIHDDLMLDVHNSQIDFLQSTSNTVTTNVPGFNGTTFYLKLKKIS